MVDGRHIAPVPLSQKPYQFTCCGLVGSNHMFFSYVSSVVRGRIIYSNLYLFVFMSVLKDFAFENVRELWSDFATGARRGAFEQKK